MSNHVIDDLILQLPLVALRGIAIFPEMILHFDVGRKKSIHALREAVKKDQNIFLVLQKDVMTDDPEAEDLYEIGVIGRIKQISNIPNSSNLRVAVEGIMRARLCEIVSDHAFLTAQVEILGDTMPSDEEMRYAPAYERLVKKEFHKYISFTIYYFYFSSNSRCWKSSHLFWAYKNCILLFLKGLLLFHYNYYLHYIYNLPLLNKH